jgi:16S rRNA (uracil1498-N3)-methyltransferase
VSWYCFVSKIARIGKKDWQEKVTEVKDNMRYFFIDPQPPEATAAVITGSDARHVKTVLRLKPGARIGLFDGTGMEYEAIITTATAGRVEAEIVRRFVAKSESPVRITIAQGLLKDKKMDGLVRRLTELGITKWIPFMARRTVPRPDKTNLLKRSQRWEIIAKEAAKQSKRARIPEIVAPVSFDEILHLGASCDVKIVFWENESNPLATAIAADAAIDTVFAILGPEGGLTSQEIETARARGFVSASLGPRILKAETATTAACVLLQYLFGDLGKKPLT